MAILIHIQSHKKDEKKKTKTSQTKQENMDIIDQKKTKK